MNTDWEAVLAQAHEAATSAIKGRKESPVNCGFAWVIIGGNTSLARHCRKMLKANKKSLDYGYKDYLRGWRFSMPGTYHGQDMDVKLAGARAFAAELTKHGVDAEVAGRND